MDNKKKIRTTGFSYMDHTMIFIYILLYLWGPGGPSIVILVPSSFPEILSPISIYVKNNLRFEIKSHLNVHQTFCSLNSGPRGGGGEGGSCHAYVDSSDIKVSAKEDLIRVETYVQEKGDN